MTTGHSRQSPTCLIACVFAAALLAPGHAQSTDPPGNALLHGYVRDTTGRPVANADLFLARATSPKPCVAWDQNTHADVEGHYRFAALHAGTYCLRAQMIGFDEATVARLDLAPNETTKIDLVLAPASASFVTTPSAAKPAPPSPAFFDEPQFTVAGVTQGTNSGGHGSDTVLRTTEALAQATVRLSNPPDPSSQSPTTATETSLRQALAAHPDDPALHHQLGDVEAKLNHPLDAVREYQRAAELDPSEPNLFDWGTELLTHRALEPATEVFTQGHRLFPKSLRMLVALGVAWYARGSYDEAAQCLGNASDLAPENPTPYLFMGRMQSVETTPSQGTVERLARFARLQPENALANYYYAVALWKQQRQDPASPDPQAGPDRSPRAEPLLLQAVRLDPQFAAAHLQLGILYAEREDFPRAITEYQKAIAGRPEPTDLAAASPTTVAPTAVASEQASPQFDELLEEAHYRLAHAYLRTGDKAKAKEQLQLHDQYSRKTKEDSERQRRQIQEFVISLRKQ